MTEERFFQVGDHRFELDFRKGMLAEKELEPYAPFQTDSYTEAKGLFTLSLVADKDVIAIDEGPMITLEDENGKISVFSHENGELTFSLEGRENRECCRIRISKDYRTAKAWIDGKPGERRYALDSALMLMYALASAKHDTILLHASAVEYEGRGYLFLGKSGTGKSTHSRLWTENIKGSELLNDDNPIVRIAEGTVYVYGSPWSGKRSCYRNRRVKAGGIARLRQAPANSIAPLTGVKAYAALLPSCSCMRWDQDMAEGVHSTLCQIVDKIPMYILDCLPNRESAELCSNVLTRSHV